MRTSIFDSSYLLADTPTVPAENFMATLAANVDNPRLSADEFREFVRNSLPVVIYPRSVAADSICDEPKGPA